MATAIDPICKMEVDTDNPPGGQSEHEGTTYYFCAPGCKVAFDDDPGKYVAHDEPAAGSSEDDHDDHGHSHGEHGHSHDGHHMPESTPEAVESVPASKPGFFARLFGKK